MRLMNPFRLSWQIVFRSRGVRVGVLFALLSGSLLCGSLNAEEAETGRQDLIEAEQLGSPELKIPGVRGVNVTHSYLSSTVESLSQRIDRFFGENRIYEEATGTYIQARGSLIYNRGGEYDFDGKFRVKVDFPQLEEKVNLVIESDDDRDAEEEYNRITTGADVNDELDDNEITAAVQFVLQQRKKWTLSVRPGLKLSDPVQTFIKLRFRRNEPVGEKWLARGTLQFAYYNDIGLENDWHLDLERAIGNDNIFRSASTVHWQEDVPGNHLLTQVFLLTHRIDHRQSLAFEIGNTSETRPNLRDLSYFSSLRYRRNIHKGWLFFELKPQVIYRRETNYQDEPALVVTLEALLGAKYLK